MSTPREELFHRDPEIMEKINEKIFKSLSEKIVIFNPVETHTVRELKEHGNTVLAEIIAIAPYFDENNNVAGVFAAVNLTRLLQ